ncbi:HEAT repeat domain-containing protein [Jiulongibacter sediminis]|uniref:HEAT repeat domain-containing protein n=1 Tax=Jiulongibacter sediminis TaxID=1605367 RepID=A0A0P7BVN3_9BACT|nr:HEAT repeat domain-containing protein [Jiulongibacter sediminis]KPM48728.1 hypothetical protein AFM12_09085 [Jiulongibacter sediminis]TBX25263.1 hypothetical protein TK44_09090 [Jiulongibacter sediminis]
MNAYQSSESEARFIDFLENRLNPEEAKRFQEDLQNSAEMQADFEATRAIWLGMNQIPVPEVSPEMKEGFNEMLRTFKKRENEKVTITSFLDRIKSLFDSKASFSWSYALIVFAVASAIGFYAGRKNSDDLATNDKVQQLGHEVEEMKQLMMISMLENPMASERMKAVSYTREITDVDEKVIDALLTTLNQDENVNVRLATLEALVEFAEHPKVREGLVQSIITQESPLVQVALADVMTQLQEKRSIEYIKQLLKQNGLNETVKEKLEETITGLEV